MPELVQAIPEQASLCQWCNSENIRLHNHQVKVANAQMDGQPHSLYRCQQCQQYSVVTWWGNQCLSYRALAQRRFLLPTVYLVIYPIACAWCHTADQVEPAEINATIANPWNRRHRYDVYACFACNHYTAVSYLGELHTYRAKRDSTYGTLYHLVEDT